TDPTPHQDPLAAPRTALRSPGVTVEQALALVRAHPVLAHTARRPGPVGLLHTPAAPVTRAEALEQIEHASVAGVLAPADVFERVRPALVSAQVMATVAREHAYRTGEAPVHDLLRPVVRATLATDPAAWAHLARTLARHPGTLPELLTEASAARATPDASAASTAPCPQPGEIRVPAGVRPCVVFLLRRLDADELTELVPFLDDATTAALLPGNVPPLANVAEAALRSGSPVLLDALARHQHVGQEYGARLRDLGDDALDLALVDNSSGVTTALRREIYAGRRAGRPRVPMHPDLRVRLLEQPEYAAEYESYALSGDPALVDHALPLCKPKRLRRIDLVDILLSVWERADAGVASDILRNHAALFPAPVRTTAEAAFAADDPTPLRELRARWNRRPRSEPALPEYRRPPTDRLSTAPLDTWFSWVVTAVVTGDLDPAEIPRLAHPARHGFGALVSVDSYHWAPSTPRPALAEITRRIGTNPEAWVVFNTLIPDFEGTLFELADLANAAAG
ncbi:hypothetical protein, partial [Streptomyces sp. SID3343]|uniref:hypothetical protein n=1 Tax=Streptomyces sp. SID3343 TaxID=2690260 RepID=UPI00136A0626